MRRVNLVTLAGAGQRFVDAGYSTPKPLISVDGLPMVIRSAQSLPDADIWIFICRSQHVIEHHVDEVLLNYFPGAHVISSQHPTDGQACSALLAKELIRDNDCLTISACDNVMSYSMFQFDTLIRTADALVWTFRNNPTVLQDPDMFGWVSIRANGSVDQISCKKSISALPMLDHAVAGTFSFQRAEYFFECVSSLLKKKRKVNGEFYLDVALDECVKNGRKVITLEIEEYISLGTPLDLKNYHCP